MGSQRLSDLKMVERSKKRRVWRKHSGGIQEMEENEVVDPFYG